VASSGRHARAPGNIGWREWVALPELGVEWIKAKVDTGARTSALHAFAVEPFERRGVLWVRFEVHPVQRDSHTSIACEAEVIDRRLVRSSSGHTQERFVIQTLVELCGEIWPIELTLSRRDAMGFRMLLGRHALRRRFVVDPGRSYVARKPPAELRRRWRAERGARRKRSKST
jgi:hypothetical protein